MTLCLRKLRHSLLSSHDTNFHLLFQGRTTRFSQVRRACSFRVSFQANAYVARPLMPRKTKVRAVPRD
jgi:hypothetical protein